MTVVDALASRPAASVREQLRRCRRAASTRSAPARSQRRRGIGGDVRGRRAPARQRRAAARAARPASPAAPSSFAPVSTMPSSRGAVDVGGGLEQHVDRRPREVHRLVDRQRELRSRARQQVVVGRREVDRPGRHRLLVLGLAHGAARSFGRRRRRAGSAARGGRCSTTTTGAARTSAGSARQQRGQRLDAAGRRADRRSRRRVRRRSCHRSCASSSDRSARSRDELVNASACAEKRRRLLATRGRGSRGGTATSRNSPTARSCSARSK